MTRGVKRTLFHVCSGYWRQIRESGKVPNPGFLGPPSEGSSGTHLGPPFSVTFWPLSEPFWPNNSPITVCSGYWRQIPGGSPGVHPGCTPGITVSPRHLSRVSPQNVTLLVTFWPLSEPVLLKNSPFTVCSGYWRQIRGGPQDPPRGPPRGAPRGHPFCALSEHFLAKKLSISCVQWLLEADPGVPGTLYGSRICLQ